MGDCGTDRYTVPGFEGSLGPAGNCVCGSSLGDEIHTEAAPGVPVPEDRRI